MDVLISYLFGSSQPAVTSEIDMERQGLVTEDVIANQPSWLSWFGASDSDCDKYQNNLGLEAAVIDGNGRAVSILGSGGLDADYYPVYGEASEEVSEDADEGASDDASEEVSEEVSADTSLLGWLY